MPMVFDVQKSHMGVMLTCPYSVLCLDVYIFLAIECNLGRKLWLKRIFSGMCGGISELNQQGLFKYKIQIFNTVI